MRHFGKILQLLAPYWRRGTLNIVFNIFSAVFAIFSVTMAIPFLGILFENEELVTSVDEFTLSMDSVRQHFQYHVSQIIINEGKTAALLFLSLLIVSMSLLKNLFHYLALYHLAPIRNGVVHDLRNRIFGKVLSLQLAFFSESRKGDIISRMTGDVQEIENSIITSLEMLFRDPLHIILYLAVLFYMSFPLTLFVLVLLPLSGFLIGRIGRTLRQTSLRGQRKMGLLLSIIEEALGGLRIIKAFNAEEKIDRRFRSMNSFYTKIMTKMQRRRYLAHPVSEFLGTTVMVIIMVYGSTLVLAGVGSLTSQAFIGYLMIFYLIIAPAKKFTNAFYNVQRGMASVDRIEEIMKVENKIVEKKDARPIRDFEDCIEYRYVWFAYNQVDVLKNINLRIDKGKTIAIVGQSGSGKSTLADLLPRFYEVERGDILIDGLSVKDYRIKDLRNLMGNVNQEPILFNESFFNNIAFGVQNVSEKDVIAAAKVANAHEFIISSKHGYYTNVGDRGDKLSGGQRQRLSIARAVLKNPPIMILDEATSSLDTESERLVQEALSNLMKNRTSLVIAHRLSTIKFADEICVMHEGEIVERGNHNELIATDGYYKKLHDMQIFS